MVQAEFKYSFFFWLDIIATLSLIPDIVWFMDAIGKLVNATPSYLSVNAIPGVVSKRCFWIAYIDGGWIGHIESNLKAC